MKFKISKFIIERHYYFNFLNAFFLTLISFYMAFFLGPEINNVLLGYNYLAKNNVYYFMNYYKIILIFTCISYISLVLSLFFSAVLSKKEKALKYFKYISTILFLLIMIGQFIKYFLLKRNVFNYNTSINEISIYNIFYQYLICNAVSSVIICVFSFNLPDLNLKNKRLSAYIFSLIFILTMPFYTMAKYYFGYTQIIYVIILALANILIALVEYEEGKKLNEANLEKKDGET